jgi:hypothetical protein
MTMSEQRNLDDALAASPPSREMLSGLWHALREEPHGRCDGPAARIAAGIAKNGAAYWYQFEDLVHYLDPRVVWLRPFLSALGIITVWVGHRPRHGRSFCGRSEGLLAVDVAAALMQLERLGFETEADLLVDALRPALLRRRYIISNELRVLWYPDERGKKEPLCLAVSKEARLAEFDGSPKPEKFETRRGYRLQAWSDDKGVILLRATKPARRRLRSAVAVEGHALIEG